eukprot:jgi/Psemu1/322307/estExt_fgenesh1_pg.C_260003
MYRRRTGKATRDSGISIADGRPADELRNGHCDDDHDKYSKSADKDSGTKSSAMLFYLATWVILFVRSYFSGITAAGNETWYPVPLIGFIRSDLALVSFFAGSLPFWFLAVGRTYTGVLFISPIALGIALLVMPGPMPIPLQAYRCCGILTTALLLLVTPLRKRPHATVVVFAAIAIAMPYLPPTTRPLFSSIPVDNIPEMVINYEPDILEAVGQSALESGPLLDFVWENRNDWVKVSHGRALGYFVFGKNFNHDQDMQMETKYSLRSGFRLTSNREAWGESDFRLHFPEKRREVSEKFRERFGSSLAGIYARVLGVDTESIVLGDTGALANMERMGFPAVKVIFPSLFWHWFNNPHTDNYLYQMDEINGNQCDKQRQRTFLIPLTEPPSAGLYYWFKNGTRVDVDYKIGNVYSFEVSVLHAIRPFPYFEWSRGSMMDARVTIQAFAIPCGDYWYITH